MKNALGSLRAPAHSRAIEPHTDHVAHGSLNGAGGDVEVARPETGVVHMRHVAEEMESGLGQELPSAFGPRPRPGNGRYRCLKTRDDLAGAMTPQDFGLGCVPASDCVAIVWIYGFAAGPEFFNDVEPVDAALGRWEVGFLEAPKDFGAVTEEEAFFGAVAPLVSFLPQKREERVVATECGDNPLVDRPLHGAVRHAPESVDDTDDGHLRVLAFVSNTTALLLWDVATPETTRAPPRSVARGASSLATAPNFRSADHRDPLGVGLNDQHLAIAFRRGRLRQERRGVCANTVDHPEHGARARRPLEDVSERGLRVREGHLRGEPHKRKRCWQREARVNGKLAIDKKVARAPMIFDRPANWTLKRDFPKPRAHVARRRATNLIRAARVLVGRRVGATNRMGKVEGYHRTPEREQLRPNLALHFAEPAPSLRDFNRDRALGLDFRSCLVQIDLHGVPSARVSLCCNSISDRKEPRISIHRSQVRDIAVFSSCKPGPTPKTVRKSALKNKRNEHEYEVIRRLHEILPAEVNVTLLADRGFGDQKLFAYLGVLGWSYAIRFRQAIQVTQGERTLPASKWIPLSGHAKMLRNVQITEDKTSIPAVVLKHQKGMKEAWCIATNRMDLGGAGVVKLYARRFTIEETFRDIKDNHFGMGLSATRIGTPERRDRVLLLSAVAQALLTLLGAAGEACGLDRTLKANTVKTRTMSLFNQGTCWYRALPNMREERIVPLMTAFGKLVSDHAAFRDIFGII